MRHEDNIHIYIGSCILIKEPYTYKERIPYTYYYNENNGSVYYEKYTYDPHTGDKLVEFGSEYEKERR